MSLLWLIPLCVGAYLIGNINFAVIISRLKMKSDIRKQGSGNPGMTNMLRSYGIKWGVVILVLDMLKGTIPALVGLLVFRTHSAEFGQIALYAAGLSAVIGHCYPVIFKFRGGKGAATVIGVFSVANQYIAAIAGAIAILYLIFFEYGSLTTLLFVSIVTLYTSFRTEYMVSGLLIFSIYFLWWIRHRQNIVRLLAGQESKASILRRLRKSKIAQNQKLWLSQVEEEV